MRRAVSSLAVAAAFLAAFSATTVRAADDLTHTIDIARSRVTFVVTHLYVARVNGRVPIVSGTVKLAPDSIVVTSINATLDARRVDTGNGDRDDDLQGPDWFDTKRFPTWTFVSTAIKPGPGSTFEIDGLLTVHGVTQAVALTVTSTRGLPHPAYHVTGQLDRHAFGMSTTPQDGLIGADVGLTLDVELR